MRSLSRLLVGLLPYASVFPVAVVGLGLLTLIGCSKHSALMPGATNVRPIVSLGAAVDSQDPRELTHPLFYVVHLRWEAFDSDGEIVYFLYAVDPPAEGDTAWTRCEESQKTLSFQASTPDSGSTTVPFKPDPVTSRDYHVFVVKAVDDDEAFSPPAHVAFTSYTVAPMTTVLDPPPSRIAVALTGPDVLIRWTGQDPDGVTTHSPVRYHFKLASQVVIQEALGLGARSPGQNDLQQYFSAGLPEAFATWDSVPAESAAKQYEGLTIGRRWYFAVSAVDEAGAYEPRFNLDCNLLCFKPDTLNTAPRISIRSSFFSFTQPIGGFDLLEDRVRHGEVPEGAPIPFYWEATPVYGTVVSGYRWCLDIEDVFDETPRENDSQTDRWSAWSPTEQAATVGPFYVEADTDYTTDPPMITVRDKHRFYVEARANTGVISLVIVEMQVIRMEFPDIPPGEQRILVFDDVRGNPDRTTNNLAPYGVFPTESALDTLLYAVGGFPMKYPPYALSRPGVFAGFPCDTLDYRFIATAGLPLSVLSHYNVVVWYTSALDAALTGSKFSSAPEGALRFINKVNEGNTLAMYLASGGQVWLFGDGVVQAIANGYVTRFGTTSPAFFPYQSGGDHPSAANILWPGNFLYDYMKVLSQMDKIDLAGAGDILSGVDELVGMTPYLPEYRTPGAPWPPEGPPAVTARGPADDPRVGPSSSRSFGRWAGLPMLSFTTEYPDWPVVLPTSTKAAPYVSRPLEVTEGAPPVSVLDTLYLYRAKEFKLDATRVNPDGKPIWFHYWGAQHGQVDWTGAPIWLFERAQLQLVADRVLAQFGFTRSSAPRAWSGPGNVRERDRHASAHRR